MVYRSRYPDVALPEQPLPDFLLGRPAQVSEKAALVEGLTGRSLSYAALRAQVNAVAAGLAARGLRKGDVLALYSPNLPEYAVAFLAVATLGAINTTVSPLYTAAELAQQLQDSGARFLVTVPPLLERAREAAAHTRVEEILVFGEAEGATSFAAVAIPGGKPPPVNIDVDNDLVVLPYSSGTTGLPKGVMLSHRNLTTNVVQYLVPGSIYTDDVIMGILPFYHIYGMNVVMNGGLVVGATIVTLPRFDLEQFLQTMQDYRITFAFLVPPIILALAKHPLVARFDLSSLRLITSGAAPLGAELAAACASRLNCEVLQGYGLTEASPVTHTAEHGCTKLGSVGGLIPNTECKIVDLQSSLEVGTGETGELFLRGPQIMKGYLNNPTATSETIDAEGWMKTGDIGYADADGDFYIVDRAKELIKYKGFPVAPAELEALLLTHPAIADAAVIPMPDEVAGEIPKAYVVLRSPVGADEIMQFVAQRVAPHKRIRRVEIVDTIPKSTSGKILRRNLVEQERAAAAAAHL